MKDRVDVMRPPQGQDKHGEPQGTPTLVIKQWPCAVKPLAGNELVQARQLVAEATHEVKGYIDPKRQITTEYYLQFGARRLDIADVQDVDERGMEYRLLCGERK